MKSKVIRTLLLCGVTPLLMGVTPIQLDRYIEVTSDDIGPYDFPHEDVNITFTIQFINQTITTGIYEQLIVGNRTTPNASVARKKSHDVNNYIPYNVTFTLPLSSVYDEDGLSITLKINHQNGTLYSKTITIYPSEKDVINPFNYTLTPFESRVLKGHFQESKVVENKEKLYFSDFKDYFLDDVYYRINLNQFTFAYEFPNSTFIYKNAYMTINDKLEYFDNLTGGKIPLKITENNGEISVIFKFIMYVDPTLLEMNLLPKTGYVATNNFYLPVNKMSDINGMSLSFEINEIGYNKTTIKWDMIYDPTTNKIGPCQNSEYCIVGGVSK